LGFGVWGLGSRKKSRSMMQELRVGELLDPREKPQTPNPSKRHS
jgi:hypothetical protein